MNPETAKTTTAKTPPSAPEKRHRQTVRGVVVSNKMDKTCVIEIQRTVRHRLYHKGLRRAARLFVHDEKNQTKVGDLIVAVSTRPLSRHKHFRLQRIVEKKGTGA